MRTTVHKSLGMAIVVLAASSLIADDKPVKGKQSKGKPEPSVVRIPDALVLDAQQQEAVAALNAEYLPKLEELKQRLGSVLTEEQKQSLVDAKRAAQQSGKDKAALSKSLYDAVKLTDQQKQQQAEIKQQFVALNAEVRERFTKLLTPEQRKLVAQSKAEAKKVSGKPAGEKKPAGKKPLVKKPAAVDAVKKQPVKDKPASKKPGGKPTKEKKPAPATAAKKGDKSTKDPSAGKQPDKK